MKKVIALLILTVVTFTQAQTPCDPEYFARLAEARRAHLEFELMEIKRESEGLTERVRVGQMRYRAALAREDELMQRFEAAVREYNNQTLRDRERQLECEYR